MKQNLIQKFEEKISSTSKMFISVRMGAKADVYFLMSAHFRMRFIFSRVTKKQHIFSAGTDEVHTSGVILDMAYPLVHPVGCAMAMAAEFIDLDVNEAEAIRIERLVDSLCSDNQILIAKCKDARYCDDFYNYCRRHSVC